MKAVEILKNRKEDPLSILYQIDEDRNLRDEEALVIISSMLDDVEKINTLKGNLREIVNSDEIHGMKLLNALDNIIHGLKKESLARASKGWRRRFLTMFEFVR
jgi:hypothetical protein